MDKEEPMRTRGKGECQFLVILCAHILWTAPKDVDF